MRIPISSLRCLLPVAAFALWACSGDTPMTQTDFGGLPADNGVGSDGDLGTKSDVGSPDGGSSILKHGILGKYSAIAATGGTLLASAYEDTYGDLVLVSAKTSALGTLTKEIVDGVPSATPTYDTNGWRGGISEAGDNVGLDTDIAVDGSGNPMISYHDATTTTRGLKFAYKSGGKWSSHSVDKAKGKVEEVGRYTSLLLSGGKPAIAYVALAADGTAAGTFKSELRWAEASTATPASATDWTITVVESAAMPCQNLCDKSTQLCVLATDGTSSCQTKGSGCTGCASTDGCVGGKCVKVLASSGLADVPLGLGLWASAVSTAGGPVIVYHDAIKGSLKAARLASGKWTVVTVKGGTGKENVGGFCSAAVDKAGTVHAAYQDRVKKTLHYVQLSSALAATVTETVDDGIRTNGQHPVGADAAITVDPTGVVKVVYQDQMTADLLYASRASAGSWSPKTLTDVNLGRTLKGGTKGYGFFSDLVVDGGQAYGSTFYFDPKSSPEGSIEFYSVK